MEKIERFGFGDIFGDTFGDIEWTREREQIYSYTIWYTIIPG